MNAFRNDALRALRSKGFAAGIAGVVIAGFFGNLELLFSAYSGMFPAAAGPIPLQLAYVAISSEALQMSAPIFCTLAYAAVFVEEYKSRYVRAYLPRAGRRAYLAGKTAATALSGGLSLLAGVLLLAGIFALAFVKTEPPRQETIRLDPALTITFARLLQKALLFFLCGCFWSLVGGIAAAAGKNRYLAYACPFIAYYVLLILAERYFRDVPTLDPQRWTNPSQEAACGTLLFLIVFVFAAAAIYSLVMRRRLRDV